MLVFVNFFIAHLRGNLRPAKFCLRGETNSKFCSDPDALVPPQASSACLPFDDVIVYH